MFNADVLEMYGLTNVNVAERLCNGNPDLALAIQDCLAEMKEDPKLDHVSVLGKPFVLHREGKGIGLYHNITGEQYSVKVN